MSETTETTKTDQPATETNERVKVQFVMVGEYEGGRRSDYEITMDLDAPPTLQEISAEEQSYLDEDGSALIEMLASEGGESKIFARVIGDDETVMPAVLNREASAVLWAQHAREAIEAFLAPIANSKDSDLVTVGTLREAHKVFLGGVARQLGEEVRAAMEA